MSSVDTDLNAVVASNITDDVLGRQLSAMTATSGGDLGKPGGWESLPCPQNKKLNVQGKMTSVEIILWKKTFVEYRLSNPNQKNEGSTSKPTLSSVNATTTFLQALCFLLPSLRVHMTFAQPF